MKSILLVLIISPLIILSAFASQYLKPAPITFGAIENIHGIPFPSSSATIVIAEQLAHTDLYLNQPVLGNVAQLTIDFDPKKLKKLDIGIRENSFWLSYNKTSLYQKGSTPTGRQQKTIFIPLSDKIQEKDRSLDVMFFATNDDSATLDPINAGPNDTTVWLLHSITASTHKAFPNKHEIKDYIKSILNRERPL